LIRKKPRREKRAVKITKERDFLYNKKRKRKIKRGNDINDIRESLKYPMINPNIYENSKG